MQKSASRELHEWSENVVNVKNRQLMKEDCQFFSVIWVKWKQSVCCITLLYFSTFYSLFLPLFALEIFKFKYDKVFLRHSVSISKFEWFEQPWQISFSTNELLLHTYYGIAGTFMIWNYGISSDFNHSCFLALENDFMVKVVKFQ